MQLQQYIDEFYKGDSNWFVKFTDEYTNTRRINEIFDIQDYLDGKHKILQKENFEWNGKSIEPKKIVLQYAKQILNFQVSYLISKQIVLSGNEKVVDEFKKILKRWHSKDYMLTDLICKYGYAFEYIYVNEDGAIDSKIIRPENSFPIFNDENKMIGFIEHYVSNAVSYWYIYTDKTVQQWSDKGGTVHLVGEYNNISGLPIHFHNQSEIDDNFGRSDLKDIISILDAMEDTLCRLVDSYERFTSPIPILIGQQNFDGVLSKDVAGVGLSLDDNASFQLVQSKLDYQTFKTIWDTLIQSLLTISSTPSVAFQNGTIANVAEISLKMLYSIADMRAGQNEMHLKNGMYDRLNKIRRVLGYMGIEFDNESFQSIDIICTYSRPMNESDVISNLKVLSDIGGVSLETLLERNPYVSNVKQEVERMRIQKGNVRVEA